MKKDYYKRIFLNKEGQGSSSHIIAEVNEYRFRLQIADCSRSIELYNEIDSSEDRNNAVHKLSLIRETADEMIHEIKNTPPTINFSRPDKRESFKSQLTAVSTAIMKGYIKTLPVKSCKIKNIISFWQIGKEHKYAAIVLNKKAIIRKYQIQFFNF